MFAPDLTGGPETRIIALYARNQALANFLGTGNSVPTGSSYLEEMNWLVETDKSGGHSILRRRSDKADFGVDGRLASMHPTRARPIVFLIAKHVRPMKPRLLRELA